LILSRRRPSLFLVVLAKAGVIVLEAARLDFSRSCRHRSFWRGQLAWLEPVWSGIHSLVLAMYDRFHRQAWRGEI
jgi:hypothetical protein